MTNLSLFPIERNRYFYGKLLTVRDFELEQKYLNDKRRLLNLAIAGPGVVCGLTVSKSDDMTLMLESGLALDCMGREIVVDAPVIKNFRCSTALKKSSASGRRLSACGTANRLRNR